MAFAYHIELTNACDLDCSYCSLSVSERPKGIMTEAVFRKVVEHMQRLAPLNFMILHHFGEPLLHPELPRFIQIADQAQLNPGFSTNGERLTLEIFEDLVEHGLKFMCVAFHTSKGRAAYADLAPVAKDKGVAFWGRELVEGEASHNREAMLNYGIERQVLHTFAGVVGEAEVHPPGWRPPCDYLDRGFVCVLHDGRVVPCAMDEKATEVLGTVDDIDSIVQRPSYELCRTCQGFPFYEGFRRMMGKLVEDGRFNLHRAGFKPSLAVDATPEKLDC